MHKFLLTVLAIAVVGLSAALFRQRTRLHELEAELAMQKETAARDAVVQQQEFAQLQERNEVFKRESEQLREKLTERKPDAAAASGAPTDRKDEKGDWMKGFAKMFTDPEMKKMMRSQQSMAVRMMYGDLVKELGLSPDDAGVFFDLLAERQMAVSSKAMAAGIGQPDAEAEAAAAETKKTMDGFSAELKNILGEERMKKFDAYERTVGDRMMLQQYQQSMSASGAALDDTQRANLLGIMTEERAKQPKSVLDPGNKDVAGTVKAMRTGKGVDEAFQQQREFNQRVLARARTVLSADQVLSLETAQKQMLDMQEMGLKMFKGSTGGGK